MKRPLNDSHHPGVYALFLRTGLAARLRLGRGKLNGAELLRAFRREVEFGERQHLVSSLREAAPAGLSRFDLRMGRVHA